MANNMVQWLMIPLVSLFHPFYISMIDINHNPKEQLVEISVRIFTEDLEKTLQKHTSTKVDIVNAKDTEWIDIQINNYISQTLKLTINGKPSKMNYLGHEIQKESVWAYFEIPKIDALTKLGVNCFLLYDFEKSQSNIFHVKTTKAEKSYKLDYPNMETEFELK